MEVNDLTNLVFQLISDSPLFICFYHDVKVIQVLDNEASFLVHAEQNLLDCGIAEIEWTCDAKFSVLLIT